jgi:hypothetical protein
MAASRPPGTTGAQAAPCDVGAVFQCAQRNVSGDRLNNGSPEVVRSALASQVWVDA